MRLAHGHRDAHSFPLAFPLGRPSREIGRAIAFRHRPPVWRTIVTDLCAGPILAAKKRKGREAAASNSDGEMHYELGPCDPNVQAGMEGNLQANGQGEPGSL
jgi:hypothetical protein